jgi:Cu/Ag efflux protein CusF
MKQSTIQRLVLCILAGSVLGSMGVIAGCGALPEAPSLTTKAPTTAPNDVYVVRGKVTQMPSFGPPRKELRVHHEAIDNFRNSDGKVVGMNSMIMDFPPADTVDLKTFKEGDKVEVEFKVWWGNTTPWLATRVKVLPPETELVFGKANPPKTNSSKPDPSKP